MSDPESGRDKLRIAVLASGSGTTLQAVVDACEHGTLHGEVVLVISNNSASGAMQRAARHGIASLHLSSRTHADPAALDRAIAGALGDAAPDIVLLAGYMKKLGPETLAACGGRVINTHPSLLPKYGGQGMYGGHVHAAVIESGDSATGISVHLVDGDYDTGAVLAQREVPVAPEDDAESLAQRVQATERPFLVEVLQQIASGSIRLPANPSSAGRD
ncbi:MAG: phosphoribosylglycinamide formyltransferase [Gammaproteobacteria bacterium]|jgi:phosphoribosylglycinamide formyltransferase-1